MPLSRPIDAVVIGASAGGVEALGTLLPALPASMGVAVFIVVHIPRDRPSLLAELFNAKCAVRVKEGEDKEPVAPGTVYFAPPDYHLLVDDGPALSLSSDEPLHYSRPSIDVLFESAADVYGDRLLGIILTGGNADGAHGLAQVAQGGGVTVVQSPSSAATRVMPEAALSKVKADQVLELHEIAELLRQLG